MAPKSGNRSIKPSKETGKSVADCKDSYLTPSERTPSANTTTSRTNTIETNPKMKCMSSPKSKRASGSVTIVLSESETNISDSVDQSDADFTVSSMLPSNLSDMNFTDLTTNTSTMKSSLSSEKLVFCSGTLSSASEMDVANRSNRSRYESSSRRDTSKLRAEPSRQEAPSRASPAHVPPRSQRRSRSHREFGTSRNMPSSEGTLPRRKSLRNISRRSSSRPAGTVQNATSTHRIGSTSRRDSTSRKEPSRRTSTRRASEEPEFDPQSIPLDKTTKVVKSAKWNKSNKASNMASEFKATKVKTKKVTITRRPVPKAGSVTMTHTKTTNNRSVRKLGSDINPDDITCSEDTTTRATDTASQSLSRDSPFRTPSRVVYHARPAPTSTCVPKNMAMLTASGKKVGAAPSPRTPSEYDHEPVLEPDPEPSVTKVDDIELGRHSSKATKSSVHTMKKSNACGTETVTVKKSSVKTCSEKSSSKARLAKSESTKAKSVKSTKASPPSTKHPKRSRSRQSSDDSASEQQSARDTPLTRMPKEPTVKAKARSPKPKPEEAKSVVKTSKSRSMFVGDTKVYKKSAKSIVQTAKGPAYEARDLMTPLTRQPQKAKEPTLELKDKNGKSSTQSPTAVVKKCSKDEITPTPPPSPPPSDKSSSVIPQSLCNSTIAGGDCECGQGCGTKIKVQVSSGHKKGIRARAMSLKLFF